jgi:hypothetical protein
MTVTSHEAAIIERLRDAADRIPVDTGALESIGVGGTRITHGHRLRPRPRPRRKALIAGVAAAALATAAATVAVVGLRSDHESDADTVTATPAAGCPAAPSDPSACSTSLVAHVASPPDWFGTPRSGIRDGAMRTGRWTSMAIGRGPSHDGIIDAPIRISVFDGTYRVLDDAEDVAIDGVPLRSVRAAGWQALATTGTPTVVVEGRVDVERLKAVLDAVDIGVHEGDPADELSLRLTSLPEGYAEIVAPRSLGSDASYHRTLADEHGKVGIAEMSDWTDPLLVATGSGDALRSVDLGNGTTGWARVAADGSGLSAAVRFLTWSPQPGVVFEIDTYDPDRSDDDLAALARATTAMAPDQWDATYGD